MFTQLNALLVALKTPMQSATAGAKTTSPLAAVAAPSNFQLMLRVPEMSAQLNALLAASKMPTQSAVRGAKTTSPLAAIAAPTNFASMLRVEDRRCPRS